MPEYAKSLEKVIARKEIETLYKHELVELRAGEKQAVFVDHEHEEEVTLRYEMIRVVPPQRAPQVVRSSLLADADGWLEVDKYTLRHPRYLNVFALGDASSLPTSKTGAAIRKQAPVLVSNMLTLLRPQDPGAFASYDGYASCPLVTGYGKMILAEFDYDKKPVRLSRSTKLRSVGVCTSLNVTASPRFTGMASLKAWHRLGFVSGRSYIGRRCGERPDCLLRGKRITVLKKRANDSRRLGSYTALRVAKLRT